MEPNKGTVVTKAVLRAASQLEVSDEALARVIGVSKLKLSRMRSDTHTLEPGQKSFDLAILFIRLFEELDSITAGDEVVARAWLLAPNVALPATPAEFITSVPGLVHTVGYLEARRALV